MCALGEHFRRYAHALRFAIGLHGSQKFPPIVKCKHYQISSGARASLHVYDQLVINCNDSCRPCLMLVIV